MKILLFIGSLILSFSLISNVFAQSETETLEEYTDYINTDVLKVKFNYPSDWELMEEVSRFDVNPTVRVAYDQSHGPFFGVVKANDDFTGSVVTHSKNHISNLEAQSSPGAAGKVDIVEDTSMTKIGNNDAATSLIVMNLGGLDNKVGGQNWSVKVGNTLYMVNYMEDIDTFDSTESTEIRNNIINSLEFLP